MPDAQRRGADRAGQPARDGERHRDQGDLDAPDPQQQR